MDNDTFFGIRRVFLIAGAAGILLGIVYRRQFQWLEAITAAGSGICCVLLVAPALIEWLPVNLQRDGLSGLIYWLAGLGGMYIVDAISKVMRNPWGAWDRYRGKGEGPP